MQGGALRDLGRAIIQKHTLQQSFYVFHRQHVENNYKTWKAILPDVKPFYAVKCNPHPTLVKTLAELGCGFDCASPLEIDRVQSQAPSSDVVYANPAKYPRHLSWAAQHGVHLTVVDSSCEIDKIKAIAPSMKCLLRIKVDNPTAPCQLSLKYGCFMEDTERLLRHARQLRIDVVGVAFHIGSGGCDCSVFNVALKHAKETLQRARTMGFKDARIVDVGGGFTTQTHLEVLRDAKATHFASRDDVTFIAEPGRYFARDAFTLFTPIYHTRGQSEVWCEDSMYGSFNCIIYDHQQPSFDVLRLSGSTDDASPVRHTVWGATCDSFDLITKDVYVPPMHVGDWLVVKDFGAYTMSAACDFNGIPLSNMPVFDSKNLKVI